MLFATIIGARPQFVKAAPLSVELRKRHREILVHTGQHYDYQMSGVFFAELGLPEPDYHLGVGSGPHGQQTGRMLERIEKVLLDVKPDAVIVFGDTNSTLAGALAAAKLHIPVAHVEAGLRSFRRDMPEEINRVLTDHLSTWLFAPTETAVENLAREGITKGVYNVGDIMYDALRLFLPLAEKHSRIVDKLALEPKQYAVATVHRAENTDSRERLAGILEGLRRLPLPVVFPCHPRTQRAIAQFGLLPGFAISRPGRDIGSASRSPAISTNDCAASADRVSDASTATSCEASGNKGGGPVILWTDGHLYLIEPLGYIDMLKLQKNARVILTDSGGMQKEACWLCVPCVTLRDETEWPETVESGWNRLAGCDPNFIVKRTEDAVGCSKRDIPKLLQREGVCTAIVNLFERCRE